MNDHVTTAACECDWPRRAVTNEWFPVTYDQEMGEYQLILDSGERGKGSAVIRHCPWCGGTLPKSKRGTFFTTPSEADMADMRDTMKNISTVEQMHGLLGSPSECVEGQCRNQYTYADRWETLDLVVFEYKEGLAHTFHGKFREEAEQAE